jgi:hypothetical protein
MLSQHFSKFSFNIFFYETLPKIPYFSYEQLFDTVLAKKKEKKSNISNHDLGLVFGNV